MKKHLILILALALSLAGLGAPTVATAAASGDTSGSETTRSRYERAVDLVEAADYEDAIRILEKLRRKEPDDPDVLNLLGYAHRKLGRLEPALELYLDALVIDPRHLGANEYLGELYLETGQLEMAEERLAELAAACPSGCEERDELRQAIEAYKSEHGLE